MSDRLTSFLKSSENKAVDLDHRKKINYNIAQYDATVVKGLRQYEDLELARMRAKNIKWKAIENLDTYLIEFEANFTKQGGKVIWAEDAEIAVSEILRICKELGARSVVKAKSMTTEEVHLNDALEEVGIEVVETDLGEYIQQLDGEPPYHIVTPAMHKSKEDVAKLFHEKLGTPLDLTPTELTMEARKRLREKYREADVGVSGANFIIADQGAIAITENEGNARLCTSFPKTHIVIVGIEKMIPTMMDLSLLWPLLATHGTGQQLTAFNTIFNGPKQVGETDGPENMYVILMNNGRTNLLATDEQREALYCIRCGACLNACPVYKNIGGHSYDTTYSGPIGSVITPHFQGMEEFKHLSQASSLCGACTEVCPVKIDIHQLLMYNRRDFVKEGLVDAAEKWGYYIWKKGMLNRSLMNAGGAKMKNAVLGYFFKNSWGKHKEMPKLASKSFNQQWKARKS